MLRSENICSRLNLYLAVVSIFKLIRYIINLDESGLQGTVREKISNMTTLLLAKACYQVENLPVFVAKIIIDIIIYI